MARRVELIAAGFAGSVALLWLVYAMHTVQALGQGVGPTDQPFFHFNMAVAALMLTGTALLIVGLSGGAYLHIIHGRGIGMMMLCVCTVLVILDLAAFEFAGWFLLPYPPEVEAATLGWTSLVLPTCLPFLEVLVTTFAVVAVLASLSPMMERETEQQRFFPSHL